MLTRVPLLGVFLPPAHCAGRRRWGAAALTTLLCILSVWALLTVVFWPVAVLLWLLAALVAGVERWSRWSVVAAVLVIASMPVAGTWMFRGFQRQVAFKGDEFTLQDLRATIEVYRRTHGRFPPDTGAVEALAKGRPLHWNCVGQGLRYEAATGVLRLAVESEGDCTLPSGR